MQHNTKNLSTNASSNKYVPEISPGMKEFSIVGNAAAQVGKKLGNSSLWEWMEKGFGWLLGGGASTTGIAATTGLGAGTWGQLSLDARAKTRTGTSSFTKSSSGGIGGFLKNLFSSGEMMIGAGTFISALGGLAAGLADKSDELTARKLDIMESLGEEELAINRMTAEAKIAAEKRQTAIGSMYMGHTNPISMVKGVKDPGPGVVVRPAQGEVRQPTGGLISASSPGLLKQTTQGVLV